MLGERYVRRNSARVSHRVPFVLALVRTPFRRAYVSRGALTNHLSPITNHFSLSTCSCSYRLAFNPVGAHDQRKYARDQHDQRDHD